MAGLRFIGKDGVTIDVEAADCETVMEAAQAAGLRGIAAECGGSLACATCHVYVEGGPIDALPPPEPVEDELLDGVAAERRAGSRLSCQLIVGAALDGLVLRIPERQI